MKTLMALALLLFSFSVQGQDTSFAVYSKQVGDSFDVTVTATSLSAGRQYNSCVFYLDANLTSGKLLRSLVSATTDHSLDSILFIGFANRGKHKQTFRRRDYIPPLIKHGDTVQSHKKNYGHADRFYEFLTTDMFALIENTFHAAGSRTLIGHSYGGLFVFYSLFKKERPFENYISLSPALWANHFNIFKYDDRFAATHPSFNNYLYLSVGSYEIFNLIRFGYYKMHKRLTERNYPGLKIDYAYHKRKYHRTQLPLSLRYILDKLKQSRFSLVRSENLF
jgi:uncharacterized protein